jgi:hypothetical protein
MVLELHVQAGLLLAAVLASVAISLLIATVLQLVGPNLRSVADRLEGLGLRRARQERSTA